MVVYIDDERILNKQQCPTKGALALCALDSELAIEVPISHEIQDSGQMPCHFSTPDEKSLQ